MTLRTRFAIIFLSMSLLLLASGHAMAALGVPIYWVEGGPDGRLGVVDFDGSGFQVLFGGLGNPTGVDLDPYNGYVYWTEGFPGKIRRANLDGSNPIDILTGLAGPGGLSLDLNNSKIYWTNGSNAASNPTVQRANLDGTNVQTLFTGPNATAIEVDPVGGKIYWTEGINTGVGRLQRANLDGSLPQTLFTASGVLYGVTVGYDPNFFPLMGRVYFSLQDAANTLRYIDINGGPTTIVATDPNYPIYGADFYDGAKRIVWANIFSLSNSGEIWQAQPNGAFPQLITTVGLNLQVNDVAVWPFLPPVPEPSTAVLVGIGLVAIVAHSCRRRHKSLRP